MKNRICFLVMLLITLTLSCKKDDPSESNKPPIIELLSPLDGKTIDQSDTLNILAFATDEDGTVKQVLFYIDGVLLFTDVAEPFQYKHHFTETGTYTLQLKAIDDKGGSTATTGIIVRVKDIIVPVVTFSYSPNWNITESSDIEFTVSATSPNGDIVKTSLYINDVIYAVDTTYPFSFTWESVPAGNYKVAVTATDVKGRVSESNSISIYINTNRPPTIEFEYPSAYFPEFLPGSDIYISLDTYDSDGTVEKIEVFANNVLIKTLEGEDSFIWEKVPSGEYTFKAKAYDDKGATAICESVKIKVSSGIIANGIVSDLIYSENDNLVFGLNQTTNKLLFINPETVSMTELTLPSSQPLAMDYSLTDKKLYILYKFSGYISVWDNVTKSLSILEFSGIADGRDIEVDAQNRRIYVLTNNGLFILDMDSGAVLLNDAPMQGTLIDLDPGLRFLFSAQEGGSSLYKYSVSNDMLTLSQTVFNAGGNTRWVAVNASKGYVVLPSGGGNGAGYTVWAFESQNIDNVLGEFDIDTYPKYAYFTTDGKKMLGTNGYNGNIHVMNAETFVKERIIECPNVDDYARITTNISNTKIVAFSYDTYYNEEYIIYIYDL